jgi:hypothetical protein
MLYSTFGIRHFIKLTAFDLIKKIRPIRLQDIVEFLPNPIFGRKIYIAVGRIVGETP